MVSYITELILIEKQHLISSFEGVASPNNVIISNSALPTRMKFIWRKCNWFYQERLSQNGILFENVIDFSFKNKDESIKRWFLENEGKDFVAFLKVRNGLNYIVGNQNIGLSAEFQHGINYNHVFAVFIKGACDTQPMSTDFDINSFFVGRDFGDDFNIDFG